MVLVVIIVAAWGVILAPSVMRRRSRTVGEIGSISHFHQQLRVLEHSAPSPIVAPAYRLRAVDGSGSGHGPDYPDVAAVPVLTVVGAAQLPRPALAFLGEDPADGVEGRWDPRAGTALPTPPGDSSDVRPGPRGTPVVHSPDTEARLRIRRRRRDTLGVLIGCVVTTFMVGFVPGAGTAWVLTALSAAALGAYVVLLVHLRRGAEERDRKLHVLRPANERDPQGIGPGVPAAAATGRYTHPSYQAAAAH